MDQASGPLTAEEIGRQVIDWARRWKASEDEFRAAQDEVRAEIRAEGYRLVECEPAAVGPDEPWRVTDAATGALIALGTGEWALDDLLERRRLVWVDSDGIIDEALQRADRRSPALESLFGFISADDLTTAAEAAIEALLARVSPAGSTRH